MLRKSLILAFVMLGLTGGCHRQEKVTQDEAGAGSSYKVYKLKGEIVKTNPPTGEVTLHHEAIPGLMDAMTMPYKLRDSNIADELHPGDVITADVLVPKGADSSVLLDHIVVLAQGRPDYRPARTYHVPARGDLVPDFRMHNQDGRLIHLRQFRGKQLLITFIYTRCPLPDFCPRVTRNFAAIERRVAADPELQNKTHLICISFDPEHDTPGRLKAYGEQYLGADAHSAFANLEFAVAERTTLEEMAKFFDLGFTGESDQTITHTLSTTLVGQDGRVVKFYPGSQWTPDEILRDVKRSPAA